MKAEALKLVPRKRIRASRLRYGEKLRTLEPRVTARLLHDIGEEHEIKAENEVKDEEFIDREQVFGEAEFKPERILEVKNEVDAAVDLSSEVPLIDFLGNVVDRPHETALESLEGLSPGPPNWKLFIEKVRDMRRLKIAPVDTMGCERLHEGSDGMSLKTKRFQLLVTLMLSSQTRDEQTAGAIKKLRENVKPQLTPEALLLLPEEEISKLIYPVGFYRRKAIYLKDTCKILLEKYDGDVPRTIEKIVQLPGVGPKMGYLLLQSAWDQVSGIGVDVHVHRLANMWRWVPATKSSTPEKTRKELEKWLPKELWAEINPLLVGFGQTWCPPRPSPKACQKCHLRTLCPTSLNI